MGLEPTLPEIYAVLGEDTTVDFLRVFGGRKLQVPSVTEVRKAYVAVQMYRRLEELKGKGRTIKQAVKEIVSQFELKGPEVIEQCRQIRDILRNLKAGLGDG